MAAAALLCSCATAVDLQDVSTRLERDDSRISRLEQDMASARGPSADETRDRLSRMEEDLKAIRREFADSRAALSGLMERFDALEAFSQEVQQFMGEYRKKGGEIDRDMENLANRLEAEVRSFGEKLKKYMEGKK